MFFAVVSLVKVIPLPQFGRWIPVLDIMTGVDCGVGRDLICQVVDGYWVLGAADAAGVLALNKEVVLGIDLRDGCEPNEALVGVGSLSS